VIYGKAKGPTLGHSSSTTITPSGAILALIGTAAQFAGSWIVEMSSDLKMFLRNCRWGIGSSLPDRANSRNSFGYHGPIDALKDNLLAQHQAISCLYFPFKAQFVADFSKLFLNVQVSKAIYKWAGESTDAWSVDATVRFTNEGWPEPQERRAQATGFSFLNLDADPILCRRDFPFVNHTTTSVEIVNATITFDPFKDERMRAARSIHNDTLHPGILLERFNSSSGAR
jgi:hypothetical protein